MVFVKETLAVPSLGELRAKLRAPSFSFGPFLRPSVRRSLLWTGLVLSLGITGSILPGILAAGFARQDHLSVAAVEMVASDGNSSGMGRLAAQVRDAVLSPVSLGLAVSDLQLQPEDFGGSPHGSRLGFLMNLLFEDQSNAAVPVNPAEQGLERSATLVPSQTGMEITVAAAKPEISQRVADYLSRRIVEEAERRGQEPGLQLLERARVEFDRADAALTGFQMRHGAQALSRIRTAQSGLRDADARISTLAHQSETLKEGVATASGMKREEVLASALPDLTALAPVEVSRQAYNAAKLALAEVNVDYGPKHPRAIAAQSAVDGARADVASVMQQALATLKRDEAAATAALENVMTERAGFDRELEAMGDTPGELTRLEGALDEARRNYMAASEKAGPFARLPGVTASIARHAAPAVAEPVGIIRILTSIGGAAIGVLLALFILSFMREDEEPHMTGFGDGEAAKPHDAGDDRMENGSVAEPVIIEPDIFDDIDDNSETIAGSAEGEAANDVALDERVHHVLMRNAVRVDEEAGTPPAFSLPPLLAAALAGEAGNTEASHAEARHALVVLREELARLKARAHEEANEEEVVRKSA